MNMQFNDVEKAIRPQILILQEAPAFRSNLANLLTAMGYVVKPTAYPAQALSWLADDAFDILVLDLDIGQLDGVEFMQNVSKLQPEMQIVVLTNKPTLRTAIAAIRAGTADYLIKPIDMSVVVDSIGRSLETLAGLKNQLARYVREAGKAGDNNHINWRSSAEHDAPGRPPIIIVPPVRLDYTRQTASLFDDSTRTIGLSRGETTVLACLMSNANQLMTTAQLAWLAWNYHLDLNESGELVRPYIHRLRRKVEQNPNKPSLIVTVRGQGYLFVSEHNPSILPE